MATGVDTHEDMIVLWYYSKSCGIREASEGPQTIVASQQFNVLMHTYRLNFALYSRGLKEVVT